MRSPRGRRPGAAIVRAAVAVAVLTAVSCGIPLDDSPRTLAGQSAGRPDAALPDAPGSTGERVVLFFVRSSALVPDVELVADTEPVTVLNALLSAKPPESDRLTSQIPTGTKLLSATSRGGHLDVNLSSEFTTVSGPALQLAVGQIVLTVTRPQPRSIDTVSFEVEGRPATVSTPNGDATEVRACDFVLLLAEPAISTTTQPSDSAAPFPTSGRPETTEGRQDESSSTTVDPAAAAVADLRAQCPRS